MSCGAVETPRVLGGVACRVLMHWRAVFLARDAYRAAVVPTRRAAVSYAAKGDWRVAPSAGGSWHVDAGAHSASMPLLEASRRHGEQGGNGQSEVPLPLAHATNEGAPEAEAKVDAVADTFPWRAPMLAPVPAAMERRHKAAAILFGAHTALVVGHRQRRFPLSVGTRASAQPGKSGQMIVFVGSKPGSRFSARNGSRLSPCPSPASLVRYRDCRPACGPSRGRPRLGQATHRLSGSEGSIGLVSPPAAATGIEVGAAIQFLPGKGAGIAELCCLRLPGGAHQFVNLHAPVAALASRHD